MPNIQRLTSLTLFAIACSVTHIAHAGWGDLLKQGEAALKHNVPTMDVNARTTNVDNATLAKGLKEALKVGGERAIKTLGEPGGYAQHADVRIPLPNVLDTVAGLMRQFNLNKPVDQFEASMNRAAESAIDVAAPVFGDALEQMTLEDAKAIYSGHDSAATDYFERTTRTKLSLLIEPLVTKAMNNAGVTSAYQSMMAQAKQRVPMLGEYAPDLKAHVTGATLDGLFLRLASEEKRIREQPVARTTEILKTVFGS